MDRHSDLVELLAVHHHGLDTLGYHRLGNVIAARAGDLYLLASAYAHLVGQFRGDFHERLRHQFHIHGIVLGPIVIVLGEAIGGADDVVPFLRGAVLVHRGFVLLHHRIVGLAGVQRILDGTLNRFVKLREGTVGHGAERHEEAPHPLGIHDERAHVFFRLRVGLEVRNVVAHPLLRGLVPPDLAAGWVPRLACEIAGRPVVHHPPICRPRPAPILINTQTGRIIRAAPLHHRPRLGPGAAVQPVGGRGGTVVAQHGKARQLLAGLQRNAKLFVADIGQRLTVDFLRHFRK